VQVVYFLFSFFFGVYISDFILNSYGRYFMLCVFVGWGDVGYVYVGVVGSWLFLRHCLLQQKLALQLYSLLFRS